MNVLCHDRARAVDGRRQKNLQVDIEFRNVCHACFCSSQLVLWFNIGFCVCLEVGHSCFKICVLMYKTCKYANAE